MTAAPPHARSPFLDPRQIIPARNLALLARLIVEGMMAGLHRSPFHGFSAEFREYRPYRPGESVRAIDWRKYARNDRTVVRLFDDETNLYASILVDKSGSMGFSSSGSAGKFEYARVLAASLAWMLVRQRDGVGLTAFDDAVRLFIPPRSTQAQLKLVLAHLERMTAEGATGCGRSIDQAAQRLRKRGMVVLISDFLDDAGDIARGLRHLRFKRQEVVALWVTDPLEADFSLRGSLRLQDAETGRYLSLDGQTAAHFYRSVSGDHRRSIERVCRDLEIDLHILSTDEPPARALLHVLEKRNRMF